MILLTKKVGAVDRAEKVELVTKPECLHTIIHGILVRPPGSVFDVFRVCYQFLPYCRRCHFKMVSRLVLTIGLGMVTTVTIVTIVILSVRLADTTTEAEANARTHTRLKETAAGYGTKCNLNRQAITSGRNESTDPCTEFEHLSCNRDRNTCDCVEGRVHDILSGGCKLKVRQPCQVSREKDREAGEDEDQICVQIGRAHV